MSKAYELNERPTALRQAGIRECAFEAAGLHMGQIEDPVLVRLRSLEPPASARTAALALPLEVGEVGPVTLLNGEKMAALCLAPGEWLLVGPAGVACNRPPDLMERLQQELTSDSTAVFDQSDGLAGLRVSGAAAPWLLGKLSGLDFARGPAAGPHCARTRMGDAAVAVHCHAVTGHGWVFDLYVDRSVVHWLWQLLTVSAPHAAELHADFGAFA
jgi:heterotetrameric sarcosine oxidase gamma subunit